MIQKIGQKLTDIFQKFMPNAFVFALLLTLIIGLSAYFLTDATLVKVLQSWYDGFWSLLEFGMQIILLIVTGFCIALSPVVKKGINRLATVIKTPRQVYFFVFLIGALLTLISFGWVVITCVLARELALRVKGINYPFLIACVYYSSGAWVAGLSSSIPLLLNTENNYMIKAEILTETISTSHTLGSGINLAMIVLFLVFGPLIILMVAPKNKIELADLKENPNESIENSIKEEALSYQLPIKSVSDILNNSWLLQAIIGSMGLAYIFIHFNNNGFDLNFNIMIFLFLFIGLILHKSPMRYTIAMKRSSSNVSGIIFQYPFYAGIMGIMMYSGLGDKIAGFMAEFINTDNYAFFSYLTGGLVNFAIPSAGGEFAVIGPNILNTVKDISAGLPENEVIEMLSRASLSVAYGESLSNLLQPFYLLLVLPVMASGIKIQARDIMGYLFLPFIIFFVIQSLMVVYWPL